MKTKPIGVYNSPQRMKLVSSRDDVPDREWLARTLRRRLFEHWMMLDSSVSPMALLAGWQK